MFALTKHNRRTPDLWEELFGMDRTFNRLFDLTDGHSENLVFAPRIAVKEAPDAFLVTAEMPGIAKEDLKIEVDRGVLNITAERKREDAKEGENWHRDELSYGWYRRSMTLPDDTDPNKIEAEMKDGVLNLRLPKTEKAKPVEVKVR
jgi:HSP20 family protein